MSFFKDFAYFSKGERNGVIILLLIIVLLSVYVIFNKQFAPKAQAQGTSYEELKSIYHAHIDTNIVAENKDKWEKGSWERENRYPKKKYYKKTYSSKKSVSIDLFDFDPNTVSIEELKKLGFSIKQARSIINYRNKGGKFKVAKDFSKMYVVSQERYELLESYIKIAIKQEPIDSLSIKEPEVVESSKTYKTLVDISIATEEELKKVNGIGEKLGVRIVKYRNSLGGLHSPEQLKEVYGLSEELYEMILPQVEASSQNLQMIKINQVYAKDLKKHPYINGWELANKIMYHRRKYPFKDWEDFQNKVQLDQELADKLKPYISFEP